MNQLSQAAIYMGICVLMIGAGAFAASLYMGWAVAQGPVDMDPLAGLSCAFWLLSFFLIWPAFLLSSLVSVTTIIFSERKIQGAIAMLMNVIGLALVLSTFFES